MDSTHYKTSPFSMSNKSISILPEVSSPNKMKITIKSNNNHRKK